jgi:hypothetical protein
MSIFYFATTKRPFMTQHGICRYNGGLRTHFTSNAGWRIAANLLADSGGFVAGMARHAVASIHGIRAIDNHSSSLLL